MGALNTYRDHVVHLTEGMEDFDGFVPRFAEDEGSTDQILNPSNRDWLVGIWLVLRDDPHRVDYAWDVAENR